VFQELVKTREAEEEGGLRSCYRPLSDVELQKGNKDTSTMLLLLQQQSNILAHQGIVNLPLLLALQAQMILKMLAESRFKRIPATGELVPVSKAQHDKLRKELIIVLKKIYRLLSWDFGDVAPFLVPKLPSFETENRQESSSSLVNSSASVSAGNSKAKLPLEMTESFSELKISDA